MYVIILIGWWDAWVVVLYGAVYALEAGRWKLEAGRCQLACMTGPRGRVLYVCSARLRAVWFVGVSWLSS